MKHSDYHDKLMYYGWICARLEMHDTIYINEDCNIKKEIHELTKEQIRERIVEHLKQRHHNFTYGIYPFLNE